MYNSLYTELYTTLHEVKQNILEINACHFKQHFYKSSTKMDTIDPVETLPALGRPLLYNNDFTCTAKSNIDRIEKLFDENISGYYQTDASCPHWVCCHFTKPVNIEAFAIYLCQDDSSYKPERLSLSSSEDGQDNKFEVTLSHKTGWFIIPCKFRSVGLLRFASEHNYTGGCDCRIHQVSIFASNPIQNDTLKHQQCLVNDLSTLKGDMDLADLVLKSKDSTKTIRCHSVIVAASSELITTMYSRARKEGASDEITLELDIPIKLIRLFVKFAYDGASVLHKYLEHDEPALPSFYAPECVLKVFGNAAPILALGRCLICIGISNIAGEHILARTSKLVEVGGSIAAWRWLGSMAPPQLTGRIGNVLADAIASSHGSCAGLLCSVTPDQLRAILKCSISNIVFKKHDYVKLRSDSRVSASSSTMYNEIGKVEKVSGPLIEVKFPSGTMKVEAKDLIAAKII